MKAHESNAQHASPESRDNVRASTDDTRRGPLPHSEDDPADWASSTLNALDPILDEEFTADELAKEIGTPEFAAKEKELHPTTDTAVSTPGNASQLVPGAYPGGSSTPNVLLKDAEQDPEAVEATTTGHMKGATTSALEAAREYAMKTGETVSGFFPTSVAAYLAGSAGHSQAAHTDGSSLESSSGAVPGGESREIPILTVQPPSQEAHPAEPDHPTKTSTLPTVAEGQTETMREGIQPAKGESHVTVTPHSGSTNTPDHEHPGRPNAREGPPSEAGGADADASTRSLAGTQRDRSLYTPGTSLFSGKRQDEAPSGANSAVLNLNAHETDTGNTTPADANLKAHADAQDTQASSGAQEPSHHPVHRDAPVTAGREHPLAAHEDAELGPTPSDAQIVPGAKPALPLETPSNGVEARPGLNAVGATTEDKVVSSVATPGHGPPPVPRKETKDVANAAAADSLAASAPAAGAGAGAGGDLGGVGEGNAAANAAPSTATKDVPTHGALHNRDGSHAHVEGKKPGFFERLKKEVKALGGKHHHHKEEGAKDAAKE